MKTKRKTVAIVTGSPAEFGLLRPVIDAVRKHKTLKLQLIAAGSHFLPPARTIKEVQAAYPVAARVPMQTARHATRHDDAAAVARGVAGFSRAFKNLKPDWVVVLGDRIEAFAAASAASIAGIAVAHIHGGDRAEGIADEAMRHAITKLAHLHCAATKLSAQRIIKMGERRDQVHVTGSPAMDGLDRVRPAPDVEMEGLDDPGAILLMHPAGLSEEEEIIWMTMAGLIAIKIAGNRPVIWLEPNHDAGRAAIIKAAQLLDWPGGLMRSPHMPRHLFIRLLKALSRRGGALVGNSSAGLIEAEATGVPVINLGPRQVGREHHSRVADVPSLDYPPSLDRWPAWVRRISKTAPSRIYGDGRSGPRIAALLAKVNPHDPALLRKRCAY